MNKNAEQTSNVRLHPGSLSSDFLSRYSYDLRHYRRFCFFAWCIMARCREHRQGETFKTHLPHKYPLQHNHKTKMKLKKENRKYGHVIYTAFTQVFLHLNYKHTSIFQLHISPTYEVPFDRYSLLLLTTSLSCQQCYEEPKDWRSDTQDRAVEFVSDAHLCR